jgi:hypothetical protein
MVLNSPLILIIDDMQDTDEISFYLFKKVVKYFKNIMLIGNRMNELFSFLRADQGHWYRNFNLPR